jgi:RNA polymerase sigma factor (TIGR02999 family)
MNGVNALQIGSTFFTKELALFTVDPTMTSPITQLLKEWNLGDTQALDKLMPYVYDELRSIALRQVHHKKSITLQPTELVHETFLRLTESHSQQFRDRLHFYGAAVKIMRRILIDLWRRRSTLKRGGTFLRVDLHDEIASVNQDFDFELLDQAIEKLASLDARQANIVELRFFGGLTNAEVASLLNISEATVKRDWVLARAWLLRELSGE